MYDVTLIGGGPAGAIAATLLARRGRSVAVVEQHRFPRDKVCGECISALGLDVLARLDLLPALQHLGPIRLHRANIFAPGGHSATIELPRPMWGLSRMALDTALLDAARLSGATFFQSARCEGITPARSHQQARIRSLPDNSLDLIDSRFVIIADGKGALLSFRAPATGDFGIKSHFVGIDAPRDAIGLFGVRGHYGGIAPIEEDRWNVAFSIPAARLTKARGDLDGLFAEVVRENRGLTHQLRTARRCGPWLTSPLPRFAVTRNWEPHIIPIGNAAAALEPIGGEGMGLAMRSAELAAEAVDAALKSDAELDVRHLQREFDGLWNVRRMICRGIAAGVSRPWLASVAIPTAAAANAFSSFVLQMMKNE